MHRDLGFSNSSKFSRGTEHPFSCVARKKEKKRLQHLFRAYTRKGIYGGRIKLVILIKSKIPSPVYTADALSVRFRGYTAPLRMTRFVIAIIITNEDFRFFKRKSTTIIHCSLISIHPHPSLRDTFSTRHTLRASFLGKAIATPLLA